MTLVRGDQLSERARTSVLAAFVHRLTKENAYNVRLTQPEFTGQLVPDVEWLRTHSFYVTRYGWLDQRYHHCEPAPAMADEWNRDMLPLGHPLASDED